MFYNFNQFPENFYIPWLEEKKKEKKIEIRKEIHMFYNFNQYAENSYISS